MILAEKIKEGDVIYTNCVGSELCYHLGIVYQKGTKKYIFHNAPTNMNRYGGSIISEPFEVFKKNREILNIIRTNVKNDEILEITKKYKYEIWDSMFFNCEDFITELVQGDRESDIRDAWKIAALGVGLMLII